jgi:hypothetical protein
MREYLNYFKNTSILSSIPKIISLTCIIGDNSEVIDSAVLDCLNEFIGNTANAISSYENNGSVFNALDSFCS